MMDGWLAWQTAMYMEQEQASIKVYENDGLKLKLDKFEKNCVTSRKSDLFRIRPKRLSSNFVDTSILI